MKTEKNTRMRDARMRREKEDEDGVHSYLVSRERGKERGHRDKDGDTPTPRAAISRVTMTGVVAGGSGTHAKPPCLGNDPIHAHTHGDDPTQPRQHRRARVPRSLSNDPLSHLRRFANVQPVDQTRFRASRLLREGWLLNYLRKKKNNT